MDLYEMVGDQYIMGPQGPIGINTLAIGDYVDRVYDQVEDYDYFLFRLKHLINAYINTLYNTIGTK